MLDRHFFFFFFFSQPVPPLLSDSLHIRFHSLRFCATCIHLLPAFCSISSLHLRFGLPLFLSLSLGVHSVDISFHSIKEGSPSPAADLHRALYSRTLITSSSSSSTSSVSRASGRAGERASGRAGGRSGGRPRISDHSVPRAPVGHRHSQFTLITIDIENVRTN